MKFKTHKSQIIFTALLTMVLFSHTHFAHAITTKENNVVPNGLVGYWNFNEGMGDIAYDKSGKANNGRLTNMTGRPWTQGNTGLGSALTFDGVDDYVSIANSASIPTAMGARTISYWAYQRTRVAEVNSATVEITSPSGQAWVINGAATVAGNTYLFTDSMNASNNITITGSQIPSLNAWHHIIFIFDGVSSWAYYLDGVLSKSGAFAVVINTNTSGMSIGRRSAGVVGYFDGLIDDVRIYNRALSQAEITRLYNLKKTALQGADQTGMVGWWKMDEGSGTVAGDSSGNRNNGTLTNMANPATATSGWGGGKKNKGTGLTFDGSNDSIAISDSSAVRSTNVKTFSMWIYQSGTNSTARFLSETADGNTAWDVTGPDSGNNAVRVSFKVGGVSSSFASPNNSLSNLNTWYHIAGTFDGSAVTAIYINGVSQTLSSPFGVTYGTTVGFVIGDRTGGGKTFNGSIDDVRIYNRALSQTEITKIYKEKAALKMGVAPNNNTLTQGLVGYWNFDGKNTGVTYTTDSSGNNNTGILTNGPVPTAGKLGQALKFDGVNDYVNVIDNASQRPSRVSVSAWIKTAQSAGSVGRIVVKQITLPGKQAYSLDTNFTPNKAVFYTDRPTAKSATSLTSINDGKWHHLVGTNDCSFITLYVDGILEASTAVTGCMTYDTNIDLMIGQFEVGGTQFFNGSIDDVRIYNRALSPDEIKRLYNAGR